MSFRLSVVSSTATYQLNRSVNPISESAEAVTITLTTTGVQNGQAIPYTITGTGITSGDFVGSPSLTGEFVVYNNTAYFILTTLADNTLEGPETFTVTLDGIGALITVNINDTSTGGDPYFAGVSLLMHMDGTNGGTSFTDIKGHTLTSVNSATTSTTQKKYGSASGLFNGSNTYVRMDPTTDMNLSSGDFTIEAFIRPTTLGGIIIGSRNTSSGTAGGNFNFNLNYPAGNMSLTGTSDAIIIQGSIAGMVANSGWYHVAATKSGTTWRLFLDGVQVGITTSAAAPYNSSGYPWTIGGGLNITNPYGVFNGYIDEVRVTKGVARYVADFTPPTAPHMDS